MADSTFPASISALLLFHVFCLQKAANVCESQWIDISVTNLKELVLDSAVIARSLREAILDNSLRPSALPPSAMNMLFQGAVGQMIFAAAEEPYRLDVGGVFFDALQAFSFESTRAGKVLCGLCTKAGF